jgi:hypothetical protein
MVQVMALGSAMEIVLRLVEESTALHFRAAADPAAPRDVLAPLTMVRGNSQ